MIPVIAKTNIDRCAMEFAGVDAGAKMFVPFVGSAAPKEAVNNKARSILCRMPRNFEEFIRRFDIRRLPDCGPTVFCETELAFQFRPGIEVNVSELRDTSKESKRHTKRTHLHYSLNPTDSPLGSGVGEAIPTED